MILESKLSVGHKISNTLDFDLHEEVYIKRNSKSLHSSIAWINNVFVPISVVLC